MIQIKRFNLDEIASNHFIGIERTLRKNSRKYPELLKSILKITSLDKLITSKPEELEVIVKNFENAGVAKNHKDLKDIFSYEPFCKSRNYNAYKLAKSLNVQVCPYCNRQYTFTVTNNKSNITRPEFDHFLSKEKYPYLALSFYNLIPSCKICNSTLKRNKVWSTKSHIHPYIDEFGNYCRFSLKIKPNHGIDFFYGKEDSFDIILKNHGCSKSENNTKDLCLNEIYNEHKDYVSDILKNSIIYDESYILSLFVQFDGILFSSVSDVKRMIFSNYILENEIEKRVLGKLTKEILDELGILQ